MKEICLCLSLLLMSYHLLAQVDEKIDAQIVALEDSVKVIIEQYGEQSEEVVNAYFDLIDVLFLYGKYKKALGPAKRCIDVCNETFERTHPLTSISLNNIGALYFRLADYKNALWYFNKVLENQEDGFTKTDSLLADSYNNIGAVYLEKGNYSKALKNIQKSLSIRLNIFGEMHSSSAWSYRDLGSISYLTSKYLDALKYYKKALEIESELFDEKHPNMSRSYNDIGITLNKIGDYAKALDYYQKSLSIALETLGDIHPETSITYENIGDIFFKTGDYDRALKYVKKALAIKLEILGEEHHFVADSYDKIGNIYFQKRNYSEALSYFQKGLELELETHIENHPSVTISFNNIGSVYKKMGYLNKAKEYFEKALNIQLKILGEKHHSTAKSLKNIGLVFYETTMYDMALENFEKASQIENEIFGQKHHDLILTQIGLAKVFETLSDYDKADSLWNFIVPNIKDQLGKNYLFLPDNKKLLYLKTTENTFNSFYNFAIKNGSETSKSMLAGLLINNKSQILDYGISTRQLIENINDKTLDSINFKLDIINQKVAKAELLSKVELEEKGLNLDSLRFLQDDLAAEVLKHPQLKTKLNPPKYSWQQIREKLNPNEALIDYFTFYNKEDSTNVFYAMLLKKEEAKPLFIPISKTKPVEDLLKLKDNFPAYLNFKEARQDMYGYLWQTLAPHLENINSIHLTPVAALNKIDFESLQNKEGQYLADLYDFHYYSSSKDFYKQQQTQPNYTNATLYGHIAYYKEDVLDYEAAEDTFALRLQRDTLRPLPATLYEVKAIEKICNKSKVAPTLLTINSVNEDTVAYYSGEHSPSIMHFATHGAYLPPLNKNEALNATVSLSGQDRFRAADNPLQRSLLMLSNAGENWKKSGPNIVTEDDGILTALEVTNLDLNNTKLVVLSACNSGIGSEHTTEGVFGLPRAFKLAGVDKILMSLWPVEDETTKELMIEFYTNLLRKKQGAGTALRNAKAQMRKQNDAPKNWAGFVLVE